MPPRTRSGRDGNSSTTTPTTTTTTPSPSTTRQLRSRAVPIPPSSPKSSKSPKATKAGRVTKVKAPPKPPTPKKPPTTAQESRLLESIAQQETEKEGGLSWAGSLFTGSLYPAPVSRFKPPSEPISWAAAAEARKRKEEESESYFIGISAEDIKPEDAMEDFCDEFDSDDENEGNLNLTLVSIRPFPVTIARKCEHEVHPAHIYKYKHAFCPCCRIDSSIAALQYIRDRVAELGGVWAARELDEDGVSDMNVTDRRKLRDTKDELTDLLNPGPRAERKFRNAKRKRGDHDSRDDTGLRAVKATVYNSITEFEKMMIKEETWQLKNSALVKGTEDESWLWSVSARKAVQKWEENKEALLKLKGELITEGTRIFAQESVQRPADAQNVDGEERRRVAKKRKTLTFNEVVEVNEEIDVDVLRKIGATRNQTQGQPAAFVDDGEHDRVTLLLKERIMLPLPKRKAPLQTSTQPLNDKPSRRSSAYCRAGRNYTPGLWAVPKGSQNMNTSFSRFKFDSMDLELEESHLEAKTNDAIEYEEQRGFEKETFSVSQMAQDIRQRRFKAKLNTPKLRITEDVPIGNPFTIGNGVLEVEITDEAVLRVDDQVERDTTYGDDEMELEVALEQNKQIRPAPPVSIPFMGMEFQRSTST